MTVNQLSRKELEELKVDYLLSHSESVSWGEIASADNLVSDETIKEEYAGTHFVPDDFFCNQSGEPR